MKIACLGWGSLIWKDGQYPSVPSDQWNSDGPILPIEFSRISQKSQIVTLVINPSALPVNVLWCLVGSDLDTEIAALVEREGCRKERISHAIATGTATDPIHKTVQDWVRSKDLDAAIWTGLPSRNAQGKEVAPTVEEVIAYLTTLDEDKMTRAKEYILKAPAQIKTQYREVIVQHFGW